jgi:hypothetical protein
VTLRVPFKSFVLGAGMLVPALLPSCGVGERIRLGITSTGRPQDGASGPQDDAGGPQDGAGGRLGADGSGGASAAGGQGGAGGDAREAGPDSSDASGGSICSHEPVSGAAPCAPLPNGGIGTPVETWRFPPLGIDARPVADGLSLVAQLTDDDANGRIDGCDVPDVVVTATDLTGASYLWLLSGATGAPERRLDVSVDPAVVPAVGDIDRDGKPEVVVGTTSGSVAALRPSGERLWESPWIDPNPSLMVRQALSLYDLDGDGTPEILSAYGVYSSDGSLRFPFVRSISPVDPRGGRVAPIAADLVGDAKLEIVTGEGVYSADGVLLSQLSTTWGIPHVANVDGDPGPEIVVTVPDGFSMFEHDGTRLFDRAGTCHHMEANLNDMDGDGRAELLVSDCGTVTLYAWELGTFAAKWGVSGGTGPTSFDFLGSGAPSAVVSTGTQIWLLDGVHGRPLTGYSPVAATFVGTPLVADVNADGSADILYWWQNDVGSWVSLVSEANQRWAPTRRIWNQAAYHVTNVEEDGTIPIAMGKSWELFASFRSNVRIASAAEGGRACRARR